MEKKIHGKTYCYAPFLYVFKNSIRTEMLGRAGIAEAAAVCVVQKGKTVVT